MTALAGPELAGLDAFGADDIATVGGKAANLGELLRCGASVPRGFVVTTGAYTAAANRVDLDALAATGAAPATLRAAVEAADLPAELRSAIGAAYRALGDDVPVAVRSSATAEDLPGAAFAGQQDSYLNVIGAEVVVDAVRACWASLWTDRAVAYRRDHRAAAPRLAIAVVVQAMVDADVAGVLFTADPVSGDRDRMVVDAGAGLGEAVVSGLVTPDHYLLDGTGAVLSRRPGRGEVVVRALPGGGVRQESPPGGRTGAALLSDLQLTELAAAGRRIAEHFGRPQDIEWAFAGGRLWILQARPMTALPPQTPPLNRLQRLQGSILTEYLPVRPYPMDVSTVIAHGPARMMNEIGEFYGVRGLFDDFLRERDGVVVQLLPSRPHLSAKALLTPAKLIARAHRFAPARWASDPRQRAFLTEIDALEALELPALSWSELLTVPGRALAAQDYCRDLRIDYLPGCGLALARVALLTRLLGRLRLLVDLLGGVRTRTEDANGALAALADRARADPELLRLVTRRDEDVTDALAAPRFADFRQGLTAFLAEFGRRETASPLLVSSPTLAESPGIVLGLIAALAEQPPATGAPVSQAASSLAELLQHPLVRGPRRQDLVRRWVQRAREAVAFREDTHFYFTAALPTLRRAILEIGARLQESGVLNEREDVFHLRWDELKTLGEPGTLPTATSERLRELVRRRRALRTELTGAPLIDPTRVFPASASAAALVTGTPAGSGTVTGIARIVRGPDDFDRLRTGEVLVCPYTNPAWTPLFSRAAAVVVDTGALASHAAIVAREYGLPAVMGTGCGTTVIGDGESITVDGGRGLVSRAGASG